MLAAEDDGLLARRGRAEFGCAGATSRLRRGRPARHAAGRAVCAARSVAALKVRYRRLQDVASRLPGTVVRSGNAWCGLTAASSLGYVVSQQF